MPHPPPYKPGILVLMESLTEKYLKKNAVAAGVFGPVPASDRSLSGWTPYPVHSEEGGYWWLFLHLQEVPIRPHGRSAVWRGALLSGDQEIGRIPAESKKFRNKRLSAILCIGSSSSWLWHHHVTLQFVLVVLVLVNIIIFIGNQESILRTK